VGPDTCCLKLGDTLNDCQTDYECKLVVVTDQAQMDWVYFSCT